MQAVFYIIPGIMMISAVLMLTADEGGGLKISKRLRKRFANDMSNIFSGTKFYVTKSAYQNVTLGIFLAALVLSILMFSKVILIAATLLLLASCPKEQIWKLKLPFHYLCEGIRALEKDKKEKELYQAMSILKNMTIMQKQKDSPIGADAMIEQIIIMADITKPAYLSMIGLLRLNQKDKAKDAFTKSIGTNTAEQMANFLITMDKMHPSQLENMISAAQERMEQERITKEREKDELYSNLIYGPIFLNVLLVIMNFLIITFFYDQKEALNMFFNF